MTTTRPWLHKATRFSASHGRKIEIKSPDYPRLYTQLAVSFEHVFLDTYFVKMLPLPPGNVYGCCFLKTWPTREQGMISKLPWHCQTRKEISETEIIKLQQFYAHTTFFLRCLENTENSPSWEAGVTLHFGRWENFWRRAAQIQWGGGCSGHDCPHTKSSCSAWNYVRLREEKIHPHHF